LFDWLQALLEGLEKKGHVVFEQKEVAIVQAIFNRCRHRSSSSSSAGRTHSFDDRCLVAVSDWRKHGAPSGFWSCVDDIDVKYTIISYGTYCWRIL